MKPREQYSTPITETPKNKNILQKLLVLTGCTAVALPLLLWASTAFGQGQEVPPATPTLPPTTSLEAAAVDELNTSGGEVWTGRPFLGTLEIEVIDTATGATGMMSASASVINLPNGKGEVVISCQHCFMYEGLETGEKVQAISFVGPEGQRVKIKQLVFDNREPSYINDARIVGVPETPIDFMWPLDLNLEVKERLMRGEVITVMVLAHDFLQARNEYFYGTLHRTTGNAGCDVVQLTVTDHACLLGRNLEGIIPGNSGGILLVTPDNSPPQPNSPRLEVAGSIRSPYFVHVPDETWFSNLPDLNGCVYRSGSAYHCITFPLPFPTATPRHEDHPMQMTMTPSPTHDPNKPTSTRTATRTPRPTTTLVPTFTASPTPTPYPTGGRGGSTFLPLLASGGWRNAVPLPDTAVSAAQWESAVITWTPVSTPTPDVQ